ncbi:hypothetical protein OAJ07_03345 [Gemmatimonadales bacterium]|nr:hypothetical protein [Gemmatimonadales bacterium]
MPGYYAVLRLTLGLTRTRKATDITIAPPLPDRAPYWYESAHIDGNTRFLGSPTPSTPDPTFSTPPQSLLINSVMLVRPPSFEKEEMDMTTGAGIGIGTAIGTALYVATNEPVWIAVGIALGAALGSRKPKDQNE